MVVYQFGNMCFTFYGLVLVLLLGTFVKKIDRSKLDDLHKRHQAFQRDHSALHRHWQDVEKGISARMTKHGQQTQRYARVLATIVPLVLFADVVAVQRVARNGKTNF